MLVEINLLCKNIKEKMEKIKTGIAIFLGFLALFIMLVIDIFILICIIAAPIIVEGGFITIFGELL